MKFPLLVTVTAAMLFMVSFLCLVSTATATAETHQLALPQWFGDHMVLQTNDEYGARSFLNGVASPGETVTVQVLTPKQNRTDTLTTTADDNDGTWKVQVNPAFMYGSDNTITATGNVSSNTLIAHNVTFGDVFLCSGQSNMVYPLQLALNASAEAAALQDFPNFRFF
ncbi:MAG: hypothetical protein SGARI_001861, partial [Bacillariaceae sp.]